MDEIVRLTAVRTPSAKPGEYTEDNLRDATRQAGLDAEAHARFREACARLNLPLVEAIRFGYALREARSSYSGIPPTENEMLERVERWGIDLDDAQRAWDRLTKAERQALNPYRGERALLQALARYGATLRKRG